MEVGTLRVQSVLGNYVGSRGTVHGVYLLLSFHCRRLRFGDAHRHSIAWLEHFHFSYSHSENGVRYQKCKAPEGPFRLLVPDPVFQAYVVHENALVGKSSLRATRRK